MLHRTLLRIMRIFMPWHEKTRNCKPASAQNTRGHDWLYFLDVWRNNYPKYAYLGAYLVINLCLFLMPLVQYRHFKMLDGTSRNVYYILARSTGTFRIYISPLQLLKCTKEVQLVKSTKFNLTYMLVP